MILNINDIKSITKGAMDIAEKDGEIYFKRFSDSVLKEYSVPESRRVRACCAAGCYFDFYTKASYIKIKYSVKNTTGRDWLYFDIKENDNDVVNVGEMPIKNKENEIEYNFKEKGEKRVKIYLPHLVEFSIKKIETDGILKPTAKRENTVLFIGDSITQGMDSYYPSYPFTVNIADFLNAEFISQSVGGACYNNKVIDENLPFDPDFVIVALGTNDWYIRETKKDFVNEIERFYNKLTKVYKNSKIIVITPIWRNDIDEEKKIGEFSFMGEAIKKECEKYNIFVIDGLTLVPHSEDYYIGIHPNYKGFVEYTKYLKAVLESVK